MAGLCPDDPEELFGSRAKKPLDTVRTKDDYVRTMGNELARQMALLRWAKATAEDKAEAVRKMQAGRRRKRLHRQAKVRARG